MKQKPKRLTEKQALFEKMLCETGRVIEQSDGGWAQSDNGCGFRYTTYKSKTKAINAAIKAERGRVK